MLQMQFFLHPENTFLCLKPLKVFQVKLELTATMLLNSNPN